MKIIQLPVYAILLFIVFEGYSQSYLKPGLEQIINPVSTDSICDFDVYIDTTHTFNFSGYKINDTLNNILLQSPSGDNIEISSLLNQNKPLLIVSGSYTCDKFRASIDLMNNLVLQYGNYINIYLVYTIEAHPKPPEICPFTGTVFVPQQNSDENIFYPQHQTYEDRKKMVDTLLTKRTILFPVLIDDPCNIWWNNFGPAANNAYLIKPDGTVFYKEGWLGEPAGRMEQEIEELLQLLTTSVQENNDAVVKIYPNPAISKINIHSEFTPYSIELFNSAGMLVNSFNNITDKIYALSLDNLSSGLYYCKINSIEHGTTLRKIVLH
ncbi:MAG: T9SS type A sorting domain-containing protein [Bacteroidia bacterium]